MDDKYKPAYSFFEINVKFKEDVSENFVKDFLKTVNKEYNKEYKLSGEWEYGDGVYIIKVDSAPSAMKNIESFDKFIDWTERYDIRYNCRLNFSKGLEDMSNDLFSNASEDGFKKKLEDIVKYIKNYED